jgi:hypothetical protein
LTKNEFSLPIGQPWRKSSQYNIDADTISNTSADVKSSANHNMNIAIPTVRAESDRSAKQADNLFQSYSLPVNQL